MEREVPDILRAYAEKLEDPRRLENVERVELVPSVDQNLLLALNKPRGEGENMHLPDAGEIKKWLKQILISVETSDQQSAILGLFFTNIDPLNLKGRRKIAVGVFPRTNDIVTYDVVPSVDTKLWQSHGEIRISNGATAEVDPFLLPNPDPQDMDEEPSWRPDLLFFKQDPFSNAHPYRIKPVGEYGHLLYPTLLENALEENVIERALWYTSRNRKPRLATQEGFKRFVGRNQNDDRYAKIYQASHKDFRDSNGNPLAARTTYPQYNF